MGASSQSGDVETSAPEQPRDSRRHIPKHRLYIGERKFIQTNFFLRHRLLRPNCNGATRPHCSTVHTNVDALEYGEAGFILQRVGNLSLDPAVRIKSDYFEGIISLVDLSDDRRR